MAVDEYASRKERGYNGVRDTMLSQQSPATSYGNAGSIRALTLKTVDGGRRHFLSDARPLVGVMTRVEITPLEMPFELGGERLTISLYFRAPVRLRAE